ncbi:iron-sulfur cluster-binding domain-containing protein [Allohahella marinimesophila]|uniref:Ferredoxin reductase n=1 Tax=Allohahella marinimesophila TaxID=1054972 RepID=A0ABP7NQZ5_9GAMM
MFKAGTLPLIATGYHAIQAMAHTVEVSVTTLHERIKDAPGILPPGLLGSYLNFLLCEIDPRLNQARVPAVVESVIEETESVRTYVLRPARRWGRFEAGQYTRIEVDIDGVRVSRNYSMSCSPAKLDKNRCISITVKQVEGGKVSNWMAEHCEVGDIVHLATAQGEFTLDNFRRAQERFGIARIKAPLFVAAGSGITPIMSMLESRLHADPMADTHLAFFVRNEREVIFANRLKQLAEEHAGFQLDLVYTDSEGLVSKEKLFELVPDIEQRSVHICGPQGFMTLVTDEATALGVVPEAIFIESFGAAVPASALSLDAKATLSFASSGGSIESEGGKTLLELAEAAGLKPKFGCRSGICKECLCEKASGPVFNRLTGEINSEPGVHVQACISVPIGQVAIVGW